MTKLASPAYLGKTKLKNRIILAPMGPHFDDINRETVEYFVRRAEGGASMVMINLVVTEYFESPAGTFSLREENCAYFREICERCHTYDCKVAVQLMPGVGRISTAAKMYPVPISASECEWLHAPGVKCHELTPEEIGIILDGFEKSMKLAYSAGADVCEIHAYGGYLNDQFLTAAWNTRTDEYGGDLKGRTRFLRDQIDIVRKVAGKEYPLIVKFCPDHGVYLPGMRALPEGLELAKYLAGLDIDALHIDVGCFEKWQLAMPPMFYQEAVRQLEAAKAVKQVVSLPVITHGRLANVGKAEQALQEEICDFVAIGRGLLADPDLPNKVAEGRPEDIRPCMSCNEGCIGREMKGGHLACAVNPFAGFECERSLSKAENPKRILVVGGGPAGCTAALLAKQAGHDVELWEKGPRIGGKVIAAAAPYMKADMISLADYYHTQLLKEGIPVKLFQEADREKIKDYAPEALIWAAGGTLTCPKSIPGLDGPNVYSCEDALKNLVPLGKRVVIVGGGQVGVEAAVQFDHTGHDVTVIEMADKIMAVPSFIMNDTMLRDLMAAGNGTYLTSTKLIEVNEKGIVAEDAEGRKEIPCDTVLLAMGWMPDASAGKSYEDICPVFTIGDSNQCRNIMSATTEAYEAVKALEK